MSESMKELEYIDSRIYNAQRMLTVVYKEGNPEVVQTAWKKEINRWTAIRNNYLTMLFTAPQNDEL